jgi:hypothetical protein
MKQKTFVTLARWRACATTTGQAKRSLFASFSSEKEALLIRGAKYG